MDSFRNFPGLLLALLGCSLSACNKDSSPSATAVTAPAATTTSSSQLSATSSVSSASSAAPLAPLDTPENAVYELLAAMFSKDQTRINRATIDVPDREILAQGQEMPVIAVTIAMARIRAVPYTHLKVGDIITLPGNRKVEMNDVLVNENRQQLTNADTPIPFDVVKIDDQWKVVPGALIAARKAAAAARARAATQITTKP